MQLPIYLFIYVEHRFYKNLKEYILITYEEKKILIMWVLGIIQILFILIQY